MLRSIAGALAVAVLGVHAGPHAHPGPHAHTAGNWNLREQRLVVAAGIMRPRAADGFAGGHPLGLGAMRHALAALAASQSPAGEPVTVAASQAPITIVRFDALVVDQLGLIDIARHVQRVAERAGLDPPGAFGSDVVARFLGLRADHPLIDADLDLDPTDPITRAEAAHSFAVLIRDGGWAVGAARAELSTFALPRYDAAQRAVLSLAVSKIGMPYVWGGTTDDRADGLAHGGYDCSGFVWRVYKLSGFPWGRQIGGRTAAQQAGEIPRAARIRMRQVQAGDLLFFGSARFRSPATEANIVHEGIALGDGWVIHSSAQGVYVLPLRSGRLHSSFAWARRVL